MFGRNAEAELKLLATQFPVVAVTGPRQSGKTTLVRSVFPGYDYANLEAPDVRSRAVSDPRMFLGQFKKGVIIDEIHQAPELFSYIQVHVDEEQKFGKYIITGSHQFSLHKNISQSLAGRVALLTLLPLSVDELSANGLSYELSELLFRGGYPKVHAQPDIDPTTVYRSYYQTYLERDVRELSSIKNLSLFQKFIRIVAGRVGQLLNYTGIANDVGVSVPTIKEWISILEASYVLFTLKPYYENFGKRMIKSPKLYFADTGLLCYLLGIESAMQVSRDPLLGNIFENYVFLELMKYRTNLGKDPNIYFYRDKSGTEVDFVSLSQRILTPIEAKAAQTYSSSFNKGIIAFQQLAEKQVNSGYVVYGGKESFRQSGNSVVPYTDVTDIFSGNKN